MVIELVELGVSPLVEVVGNDPPIPLLVAVMIGGEIPSLVMDELDATCCGRGYGIFVFRCLLLGRTELEVATELEDDVD